MADLDKLFGRLRDGEIDGSSLKGMVNEGSLTKADRRKLTRMKGKKELSERQKLRLGVKEKKALPGISRSEPPNRLLDDMT